MRQGRQSRTFGSKAALLVAAGFLVTGRRRVELVVLCVLAVKVPRQMVAANAMPYHFMRMRRLPKPTLAHGKKKSPTYCRALLATSQPLVARASAAAH